MSERSAWHEKAGACIETGDLFAPKSWGTGWVADAIRATEERAFSRLLILEAVYELALVATCRVAEVAATGAPFAGCRHLARAVAGRATRAVAGVVTLLLGVVAATERIHALHQARDVAVGIAGAVPAVVLAGLFVGK